MNKISDQAIAKREATTVLNRGELELVKRTIAIGASDEELQLYLRDCERRGVHPLDKLLVFSKAGGKYTPIITIDYMRSRAAESGEMAGSDDAVFEERDNKPYAASVTVYRITSNATGSVRYPYSATARFFEYYKNSPTWNKMPHVMLAKCAEALALRKAFPAELAGLYTREEMEQAGIEEPPPSDRTPMKVVTGGPVDYPAAAQAGIQALAQEPVEEEGSDQWWRTRPDKFIMATGDSKAAQGWEPLRHWWLTLPSDLQDKWQPFKKDKWQPAAREVEQNRLNAEMEDEFK